MSLDVENKIYEMCAYVNVLPKMMNTQQVNENNKKNKTVEDSNDNDINSRVKRKASVLNYKQRYLQEYISLVQAKEVEIKELEKTLQQAKRRYSKNLNYNKKESDRENIRIKTLSRKVNELESKKKKDEKDFEYEEHIVTEEEKIISLINDTLQKVDRIKNDLNIHKSKLLSLEGDLKKDENGVKKSKENFHAELIVNSLDFIRLEGSIDKGLIINIYI